MKMLSSKMGMFAGAPWAQAFVQLKRNVCWPHLYEESTLASPAAAEGLVVAGAGRGPRGTPSHAHASLLLSGQHVSVLSFGPFQSLRD